MNRKYTASFLLALTAVFALLVLAGCQELSRLAPGKTPEVKSDAESVNALKEAENALAEIQQKAEADKVKAVEAQKALDQAKAELKGDSSNIAKKAAVKAAEKAREKANAEAKASALTLDLVQTMIGSDGKTATTKEQAKKILTNAQQKAEDDKARVVEAQKALDRAKAELKGDSSNNTKKEAVIAAEKAKKDAYLEAKASAFALILLQATFPGHGTTATTEKVEEQEKIAGAGTPLEDAAAKKRHIVTFNTGSGASEISPKSVENGKKLDKPEDPTRSGYNFEAWFREASLTNEFNFTTDTITQAITLHAKWVREVSGTISHTVTFNTVSGASAISPKSVRHGEKLDKPEDPERSGYKFKGWFKDMGRNSEFSFTNDAIISHTILYAKWVQVHAVTFDVDDGEPEIDTQTVEHNQKATRPANPGKAGYTFAGWFDKSGETDDPQFDFDTLITAPLELEADWEKKRYTVQFADENGVQLVDADGNNLTDGVQHGEVTATPTKPSKVGHKFDGWYTAQRGGQKFVFTTVITQNITLYARWVQVHDVTFDVDGGEPNIDTQTVEHNQKATRPENHPVKTGYTFAGWFDKNGEMDDPQFDFDTLIIAPLQLEAEWEKKRYTVQFADENGMQLFDTDGNDLTAEVLHGEAVTEPEPSKAGHTFDGWYTAQEGGQKFVFTTVITENITLYARWIANRIS